MSLQDIRNKIDDIDTQIVKLFTYTAKAEQAKQQRLIK